MKNTCFLLVAAVFVLTGINAYAQPGNAGDTLQRKWWKEAIVYQIYPRSFKDSDGDGIGDLKGIISKLDYIKSLGVNVVWLNPIYSSPNDDNGYDISDYRNIMKDFGTMEDFDAMLKGMHERGIKFVMDLVVNHSSDEHEWFKQAKRSRNSPYRNYYHWWNAEDGKPPYRYSLFDVNHDAWMFDSATNSWYLHFFSRKQPDLNWENPILRKEVYDIIHFWAAKGVDGYRLDAFGFAAKDTTWPMFPKGFEKNFSLYYSMQGNLHGYLQEMNKEVLSKYNVMSVAEGTGNTVEDAHNMVDAHRHELNMAYPFDLVDGPTPAGLNLMQLKQTFTKWNKEFADKGWMAVFLANHDQARMVTRFGNDSPQFRELSSKMLTTLIMTMRGTPYYYNGDELGMTNIRFNTIEDYNDVGTRNEYQYVKNHGGDTIEFLKQKAFDSRDNGRTPFQWDNTTNAGFTAGKPWLKVNPNYTTINRTAQEKDPNSPLNYFRKVVKFRKDNLVLTYGSYILLDSANSKVFAYKREAPGEKMLILLNFSNEQATSVVNIYVDSGQLLLTNYKETPSKNITGNSVTLRPYEALVYKLN